MLLARNKGWIGVDVGTHAVKLAQVERQGTSLALIEAAVIQRLEPWDNPGSVGSRVQESEEELVAARLLGEAFVGRGAATVLPMALCQLKSMQVAAGTKSERRAAIARELASAPVHQSGAREFDFWPLDNALENDTIVKENVSIISLPAEWAARIFQDHQQAGLECRALDGLPLALARAVGLCERADTSRPVAVLDWGFSRATFCIVFNGRPLFVRCLRDCEFGLLIRALRDALNLTWDEARRIAIQHAGGVQTRDPDDAELLAIVMEVIAPVVSELKAELHRTLVYLQLHRSKLVPQQLWLFGGGAAIAGIAPMLESQIEMNVRCWELGEPVYRSNCAGDIPVAMLGPAISLSCLAWEAI